MERNDNNLKFELRPLWQSSLSFDWKLGLFLIILVCIPRFILVLNANQTGNYRLIGLVMTISALVPFIFLSKFGRHQIGIRKTNKFHGLVLAFIIGIVGSLLLYYLGSVLYGNTYENWYLYIGKSYNIPDGITADNKRILFLIMAGTGMIFSPVGEELFFRGVVHGSFAKSLGEKKASVIDSTAFAFTHIAHFGIVFVNNQWDFYVLPTIIWVISMYLTSMLFIKMKNYTGSIWNAVLCHSGFNLGMIYCIFYWL